MSEQKYPLRFNGTIDGVENPVFEKNGSTYESKVGDTLYEFWDWQVELMPDKFTPIQEPQTHTISIKIDGKEGHDFKEVEAPAKITVESASGTKAFTVIDGELKEETEGGENWTIQDMNDFALWFAEKAYGKRDYGYAFGDRHYIDFWLEEKGESKPNVDPKPIQQPKEFTEDDMIAFASFSYGYAGWPWNEILEQWKEARK